MKANADRCIGYVLQSEGEEYTNDPRDPGGPTKWGITIYDVRMYLKKGATAADVKRLTRDVAIEIYKSKYWDALRCDDLPSGLDYTIFDYGVNSGIARSGKILHNIVDVNGGWKTTDAELAAIKNISTSALITKVNDERIHFLQGLRTWDHFGRGWGSRVASVRKLSLQMVRSRGTMYRFMGHGTYGPGKGWTRHPVSKESLLRGPDLNIGNLDIAAALFGGLLAIKNRKVVE